MRLGITKEEVMEIIYDILEERIEVEEEEEEEEEEFGSVEDT